jgi:prepilin-type N-terminal cleavage/methylation domain-containing protein
MPHAGESHEHSVRPEAFTLIELLVVLSVIAVLMAILTPALSRARKLGQSAVCQAHLRQWGTVFFLYTADNSWANGAGPTPTRSGKNRDKRSTYGPGCERRASVTILGKEVVHG